MTFYPYSHEMCRHKRFPTWMGYWLGTRDGVAICRTVKEARGDWNTTVYWNPDEIELTGETWNH